MTQLGDRVNCLSSALMGILMKSTNDRSMLCLDKPYNSTYWYLLKGTICNTSDVRSKKGFIKNNDIRITKSTICIVINKRATRALDVLMDGICLCTIGKCMRTSMNNNKGRNRRRYCSTAVVKV
jgi:hypothetical protein